MWFSDCFRLREGLEKTDMWGIITENALEFKPMFVKPECPLTAKALKALFQPIYSQIEGNPSIYDSELRTFSFWEKWLDEIENTEEGNNTGGTCLYWFFKLCEKYVMKMTTDIFYQPNPPTPPPHIF